MTWMLKVAIQSLLAHVPCGEALNHRLQWLNGRYTPERLKQRTLEQAAKLSKLAPYIQGGTIVEVGTGWELIAPILFRLMGARHIFTYDHVTHLRNTIPQIVCSQIDAEEIGAILGISAATIGERLPRVIEGITYKAPADACNTGLPAKSVDIFFTYEVLEHVPQSVLDGLVIESKRILKPSGVAYHAVEPGDHYTRDDSHINHFKYPEWLWSPMVKNKISYHNRLTEKQFIEAFRRHGAEIIHHQSQRSDRDIANLKNGFRPNSRFSSFSPEELAVWYSEIMYRFPTESQS